MTYLQQRRTPMNNSESFITNKRVRMLLRVSSNQQLDADGDLSVQRQILLDYIDKHPHWIVDAKEYFEGGVSGYKHSVSERDILQEALKDAKNREYDILLAYKDDRLGRRMEEVPQYIFELKRENVDIYTVKDNCISPNSMDAVQKLMLYIRYCNAEKSSADTGMRVKDTAKQLVKKGKFMGGKAPYGYKLEFSGEISKHGRALKHPVIVSSQAEIVKYIYNLYLNKEYGSQKIAKLLNEHEIYKYQAPNDVWRSGTITSILTNPLYAGYTSYNRREHIGGKYVSLHLDSWIMAEKPNPELIIIDENTWQRAQDKRKLRRQKLQKTNQNRTANVISCNKGTLSLIDVLYCGYCGRKMTNGSKYNYWTIKDTGERRSSLISAYKCQNAQEGIPHAKAMRYRADKIEPIIFSSLAEQLENFINRKEAFNQVIVNNAIGKKKVETKLKNELQTLEKIKLDTKTLMESIPKAIRGDAIMSLDDLKTSLEINKEKEQNQLSLIAQLKDEIANYEINISDWEEINQCIPNWHDMLLNADTATKRVLVNRLVERIEITKEEVNIYFKIKLDDFFQQPRISDGFGVSK